MALSKELLDILVCPQCKGDIELTPDQDGLICHACKLCYPIKDNIPVMLIEEATKIGGQKGKSFAYAHKQKFPLRLG
jgi:uncharacterized protein YbaR (Trm112 family)